jgi:hypothetical protein
LANSSWRRGSAFQPENRTTEGRARVHCIEARNGLYGFRDLAAARQVAGLLAAGMVMSVITKSLHEIRKWLPDAGLSNPKLFPESSDRILVGQMKGHTDKTGQFVLSMRRDGFPSTN